MMARIQAISFGPDKLFQVLFPHQQMHPDDMERAFKYSLQAAWWDYSQVLLVSYEYDSTGQTTLTNSTDSLLDTTRTGHHEGQVTITGLAQWQRVGVGSTAVWNCGAWDPRRLIHKLIQWRTWLIYRFIRPCRASPRSTPTDPDPLLYTNFMQRCMPYSKHLLEWPTKPWRKEHWSLENLAVHPRCQGRGLGRELVVWGLGEARSEEVPCVVVAAAGKERFYQKCGFTELVGYSTRDVEGLTTRNPMGVRGVEGGAVLWSQVKEDENVVVESRKEVEA